MKRHTARNSTVIYCAPCWVFLGVKVAHDLRLLGIPVCRDHFYVHRPDAIKLRKELRA